MDGEEKVEMVRKVYAKDLRDKDRVNTVFRVHKKSRTQARSGKAFLQVTLVDRSGELDARVFEKVDELAPVFAERDYVLVEGAMISFHGKPQLVIERLEKLDPEPIDPAEFELKAAPAAASDEGRAAPERMRELVERVHDAHVKALLRQLLEDPEVSAGLRVAQGPRGSAFAHKGGAADHIASLARLSMRVAEHFPVVDRDLVAAGAVLQELGRVRGAGGDRPFESTDQGRLVGAAATAAQLIREKARGLDGFPPLLEQHLTHLAIAGRGVPPATVEALVVCSARELHDRMSGWLETMAKDSGGGHWTDPARHADGALWKGSVPTSRGRPPVEGKPKAPKKREPHGHSPEPKEPASPKVSAFKPLSELSPGAASEPTEAATSVPGGTGDGAETAPEPPAAG